MAVHSENERNKAVVDEFYKAGIQGHLTSFAQYRHPDFTVTDPTIFPGRVDTPGQRSSVTKYCQVLPTCSISHGSATTTSSPRMAASWRLSTWALLAPTRSSRSPTIGRSGMARPPRSGSPISSRRPCSRNSGSSTASAADPHADHSDEADASDSADAICRGQRQSLRTRAHWDPAVTDGFAKDREIILFNNAGLQPSRRHCWRVVRSRPGSCGCCGHPGWSFATPIRRADECYCAHEEIRDEDRNRTS